MIDKDKILKTLVKETYSKHDSISSPYTGIRLSHPDIDIVIQFNHYRSQLKNYDKAKQLFELALMEI